MSNAALTRVLAGVAGALVAAGPLLDDGVVPSDVCAILLAGLTGTGLVSVGSKVKAKRKARKDRKALKG